MSLSELKKLLQEKLECLDQAKKQSYYKAKIYLAEVEPILKDVIHFLNKLEE